MRKSTENAIKTLLRMDTTVSSDVSMAVIAAMRGGRALPDPTQDMTVAEAADYLGISRTTLWRWCAEGKVMCDKRGKKFFVKAASVSALKKEVA